VKKRRTRKKKEDDQAASGSVTVQELTLTAQSASTEYANQKNDEYDLDLFIVNSTLSGTYVLKLSGQS
jgi:hypothetical protein